MDSFRHVEDVDEEAFSRAAHQRKISDVGLFAASLLVSLGAHGAVTGLLNGFSEKPQGRDAAAVNVSTEVKIDTFIVDEESRRAEPFENALENEDEFDAFVERMKLRIGMPELTDRLKLPPERHADVMGNFLLRLYDSRIAAFNKSLADDLKDGHFEGNLADFLMKAHAYHATLENLEKGKIEVRAAGKLTARFEEVLEITSGVINSLPPGADELTMRNALQKAFFTERILRKLSGGFARFDDILLKGIGNCYSSSDLSAAVQEEYFGRGSVRYIATVGHMRTGFVRDDGKVFAFENTSLKNSASPLRNSRHALVYPPEVNIMRYLLARGYALSDFPEDLARFAKQREGTARGGYRSGTNSIFGAEFDKGYCENGKEECFADEGEIDVEQLLAHDTHEKFKKWESLTIAELINYEFVKIDMPSTRKGVFLVTPEFTVNRQRYRQAVEARLRKPNALDGLYPHELHRLREILIFALRGSEFARNEYLDGPLKDALNNANKNRFIAEIIAAKDPLKKKDLAEKYVKEYHNMPVEIARQLHLIPGISSIMEEVADIDDEAFDIVLKTSSNDITLGAKGLTKSQIQRMVQQRERAAGGTFFSLNFPNLVLEDLQIASLFKESAENSLTIAGLASADVARGLVDLPIKILRLGASTPWTPQVAAELKMFEGILVFNVPIDAMPEEFLRGLAHAKAHYLIFEGKSKTLSYEKAQMLASTGVKKMKFEVERIDDPAVITTLAEFANHIEFNGLKHASHQTIQAMAEAEKKHATRFEIEGNTSLRLQLSAQRMPTADEVRRAEDEKNEDGALLDFVNEYDRITPRMVELWDKKVSTLSMNQLQLVELDVETAHAIKRKLELKNEPCFLVLLDISPEVSAVVGATRTIGFISFVRKPSPQALQNLVKNRPTGGILFVDFKVPIGEDDLRMMAGEARSPVLIPVDSIPKNISPEVLSRYGTSTELNVHGFTRMWFKMGPELAP